MKDSTDEITSYILNLAEGMRIIREAHRYCSGHEFEVCPMWIKYCEMADRFLEIRESHE